jgi:hypothetical protein
MCDQPLRGMRRPAHMCSGDVSQSTSWRALFDTCEQPRLICGGYDGWYTSREQLRVTIQYPDGVDVNVATFTPNTYGLQLAHWRRSKTEIEVAPSVLVRGVPRTGCGDYFCAIYGFAAAVDKDKSALRPVISFSAVIERG